MSEICFYLLLSYKSIIPGRLHMLIMDIKMLVVKPISEKSSEPFIWFLLNLTPRRPCSLFSIRGKMEGAKEPAKLPKMS